MTDNYIKHAFTNLHSNRDIVIGPANDGGYVLIGACKPYRDLFKKITWGIDTVLADTMQRAKSLGLNVNLLSEMIDIDEQVDLQLLASKNMLPGWASSLMPSSF